MAPAAGPFCCSQASQLSCVSVLPWSPATLGAYLIKAVTRGNVTDARLDQGCDLRQRPESHSDVIHMGTLTEGPPGRDLGCTALLDPLATPLRGRDAPPGTPR